MGIKKDRSLWAWGSNASGELGDGTQESKLYPVKIDTGYIAISAGNDYSIAIKSDGSLWAWGSNSVGQLGDSTKINRLRPYRIGSSFLKIEAGEWHALAIKEDATLWAWGGFVESVPNMIGQDYLTISAGKYPLCVAIKQNGDLMQIDQFYDPDFRMLGSNYVAVTIGAWGAGIDGSYWEYWYSIKSDGTLWDNNTQIGSGFSAISTSWVHLLALKNDGTLWALGSNYYGQLGDGTTEGRSTLKQIGGK